MFSGAQALNFILLYRKHEVLLFQAMKPHDELPVKGNYFLYINWINFIFMN